MKIIHSADQHLDSKMQSHLSKEKAKERNAEIRQTFVSMVEYGADKGVDAILLAGDLFDRKVVSKTDQEVVKNVISTHPDIEFYYIRGNHDDNSFLASLDDTPDNLILFDDSFKSYRIKESSVVITGAELLSTNSESVYNTLDLSMDDFNIVMLHGQESEYDDKDKTEVVALSKLKNRGIDYLALGHIHAHKEEKLDARGTYIYPGCLEGRGFDECGQHGFIMLDIDTDARSYTHTFVPFAHRLLHEIHVDITGLITITEIEDKVRAVLLEEDVSDKDLVKIVVTGQVDMEANVDLDYLNACFKDAFYFVRFVDSTAIKIDYSQYAKDESLKGEFVRKVQASDMSDDEKSKVIKMGIALLKGEKL